MTKDQILTEMRQLKANEITEMDSEVYDEWMNMAGDWLADDPSEYLKDGFKGFNERSPEEILCDFYLASKVSDMTEDEFNNLMDGMKNA